MSGSGWTGSGGSDSEFVSCPFPTISPAEQCARIASVVLVMVLSLLGNSLVIHVVRRNRKLWTVTNYFITNLAAADLLITIFNMAELLQRQISGTDEVFGGTAGQLYCRVMLFVQTVSMCCSVLTLTAIAVERFCSIVFPLKKIITMLVARRIIAAVWLLSCIISAPFLYAIRTLDQNGDGSEFYCVEDWAPLDSTRASQVYYALFFCVAYFCPLVIIAGLYFSIGRKLHQRTFSGNSSFGYAQRRARMLRRVVKILVAVVMAFAVCWLPQHVSLFVHYFALDVCPPEALWFGGELLGYGNSAVNPCIYIVFHAEYRAELARLVQKVLPCVRNVALPASRLSLVTWSTRTVRLSTESRLSVLPTSPVVMTRFNSERNLSEYCV